MRIYLYFPWNYFHEKFREIDFTEINKTFLFLKKLYFYLLFDFSKKDEYTKRWLKKSRIFCFHKKKV